MLYTIVFAVFQHAVQLQSHWFSESGIVDFFVILGPSPAEAVAQYARLTGFQDLPPMFSIAYHQCRWNYKDTEDVRQVAAGFDEVSLKIRTCFMNDVWRGWR